ncbi:hypothetical protein BJV78DRAFT_1262910, partial [Lactifluus subvellereus]
MKWTRLPPSILMQRPLLLLPLLRVPPPGHALAISHTHHRDPDSFQSANAAEHRAFGKPPCGAFVVETTCGVVAYGWIWRGEPLPKLLSQ